AKIAEMVKEKGIVMHTDAVQAVGKVPIDLAKVPVDMLSLSGHKLHAPKGIGALFVRKGTKIAPYMTGGHQESNRRGGTENVPYIVGLGKACELAMNEMDEQVKKISTMRDRLERELLRLCPNTTSNGAKSERLPNTTNISFQYVEGEAILLLMNELGICASSGSACTSGSLDPSHVLKAMDIPFTLLHGSIRFSLSHYNTEEEIDLVIKELPPIIKRLRDISPFGRAD
ncbi:MAG: aminotransferase class V-fold PLP-dependent enzyme, partial [Nitrospinota bacterium]